MSWLQGLGNNCPTWFRTKATPSAPTISRHRMTLHLGFCKWLQSVNDSLAQSGFCRWATVDTSPQGGIDWVLMGSASVGNDDLRVAFELSVGLCHAARDREKEREAMSALAPQLQLQQGVPTGVGSGRASLQHKVHALAHAERLRQVSWQRVAQAFNSTITFTGDLGVECKIVGFRMCLKALMGDWIEKAPGGACEEEFEFHADALEQPATDDEFEFEEDGAQEKASKHGDAQGLLVDCTGSIFIAGILHIVQNCTADLSKVLAYWPNFLPGLTHICRLLSRPWSRSRLLHTCFGKPPQSAYKRSFSSFNQSVYQGRWSSVVAAIHALLPLQEPLRQAWSLSDFTFGQESGAKQRDDGEHCLRLEIADAAIRDDIWWAYAQMLAHVADALAGLAGWSEGCPCHDHGAEASTTHHHRHQELFERTGHRSCPMATRRAPECAAGDMVSQVQGLFSTLSGHVLMSPGMRRLKDEEKSMILTDFAAARKHVYLTVALKLSFWRHLPWVLFGIAHHQEHKARASARRALALFHAAGDSSPQHVVAAALCAPGTVGHEQLTLFASGERGMSDLPALQMWAARFRFATVSERWIESRHALVKKGLRKAPRFSPAFVAFDGVKQQLREMLQHRPREIMGEFAARCLECQSLANALESMGMANHPSVVRISREIPPGKRMNLQRNYRREVTQIMYHIDSDTLFQDLPRELASNYLTKLPTPSSMGRVSGLIPNELVRGTLHATQPPLQGGVAVGGASSSSPDLIGRSGNQTETCGGTLHDALCRLHALRRLREVALEAIEEGRSLSSLVFSIRFSLSRAEGWGASCIDGSLVGLALPQSGNTQFDEHDTDSEFDFGGGHRCATTCDDSQDALVSSLSADRQGGLLLFTLQHLAPSRVAVASEAPKVQDRDAVVISKLDYGGFSKEKRTCQVFLEREGGDAVRQLHILTPSMLSVEDASVLWVWSASDVLDYSLGLDIPLHLRAAAKQVVQGLVRVEPDATRVVEGYVLSSDSDGSKRDACKFLEKHGLVNHLGEGASAESWHLTDRGVHQLRVTREVRDPKPVLQPRPDVSIKELSTIELHRLLVLDGWECRVKDKDRARRSLAPGQPGQMEDYVVGGLKVWWFRSSDTQFQPSYFVALLLAHVHGQPVKHLKTAAYYEALIDGRQPRASRRRGIEFDFEASTHPDAQPKVKRRRLARPAARRRQIAREVVPPDVVIAGVGSEPEGMGAECDGSSSGASGSSEENGSSVSENNQQAELASGVAQSAHAGARDQSSSSSASSSSSSSSNSTSSGHSSRPSPAAAAASRDDVIEEVRPHSSGTLRDTTSFWFGFKFTQVFDRATGDHNGFEVTCYMDHHKNRGRSGNLRCRKTMRFARNGGEALVERKLKLWCLCADEFDNGATHVAWRAPADIPSLRALEGQAERGRQAIGQAGAGRRPAG